MEKIPLSRIEKRLDDLEAKIGSGSGGSGGSIDDYVDDKVTGGDFSDSDIDNIFQNGDEPSQPVEDADDDPDDEI